MSTPLTRPPHSWSSATRADSSPDSAAHSTQAPTSRSQRPGKRWGFSAGDGTPITPSTPMSASSMRWVYGAWLLVCLMVAGVLTCISLVQWKALLVPSWDLAIFSEAAKSYSQGDWPIVPIKGPNYNLLGDHFHPILVTLGPLWALAPTPLTLLVAQNLLIALSCWPLMRLAFNAAHGVIPSFRPSSHQRHGQPDSSSPAQFHSRPPASSSSSDDATTTSLSSTGWGWMPALALSVVVGLGYGLSWGMQDAVHSQFHEIAWALPFLACCGAAFVRGQMKRSFLWSLPLLLVKEDMGLTVVMVGVAIIIRVWCAHWSSAPSDALSWRERFGSRVTATLTDSQGRWGAWAVLTGALAFVITTGIILPAFNPDGVWAYGLESGDSGERSGLIASLFSPTVKLQLYGLIIVTAGVVGLRSPWFLVITPTVAWRVLADKYFYWQWDAWHYNAILMPILVTAGIDAALRFHTQRRRSLSLVSVPTALVVLLVALTPSLGSWAVMADYSSALLWPNPGSQAATVGGDDGQGSDDRATRRRQEVAVLSEAMRQVPAGSTVQTDLTLLAALVPEHTVSWVGSDSQPPQYIVIDGQSSAWGGHPPQDAAAWAEAVYPGTEYELAWESGGVQIAHRVN